MGTKTAISMMRIEKIINVAELEFIHITIDDKYMDRKKYII